MKILIRIVLLFLSFSCLFSSNSISQTSEEKSEKSLHKNAVYVSAGLAGLAGSAFGTYERILGIREKDKLALLAKVGYGKYAVWTDLGNLFIGEIGVITGKKSSHAEINLGVFSTRTTNHATNYSYTYPAISLAYRYQKPGGHFIFRTGMGVPDAFFISLGVSF